jgi:cytochrome c-type biogenesis protein CcmH
LRLIIAALVASAIAGASVLPASVVGSVPGESAAGAEAPERKANFADVEENVMCPVCGTLLGLSEAPAADRQRVFIKRLIAQGLDEQQIEDALVAEYGPQVLALPDDEGINAWAYLVPLIGLIGGAVAVVIAALLWRRNSAKEADPEPTAMPEGPAAERLDRDLERFDGR